MPLAEREIRVVHPEQSEPKVDRRLKAEFDSHMTMIRCYVAEARDRETGEYLLRGLRQQCKLLAERFGLRGE